MDGRLCVNTVLRVHVDGGSGSTCHVEHAEGGEQTSRRQLDVYQQQVVHNIDTVRGEEATHPTAVGQIRGVRLVVEAGVYAGGVNPDTNDGKTI